MLSFRRELTIWASLQLCVHKTVSNFIRLHDCRLMYISIDMHVFLQFPLYTRTTLYTTHQNHPPSIVCYPIEDIAWIKIRVKTLYIFTLRAKHIKYSSVPYFQFVVWCCSIGEAEFRVHFFFISFFFLVFYGTMEVSTHIRNIVPFEPCKLSLACV